MFSSLTRLFVRPYRQKPPTRTVAIVVPLAGRPGLTPDEEVSLRQLRHYLGHYDIYFVAAEGMEVEIEGDTILRFPSRYFGSAAAHGRLLYDPRFYKTFADYRYMFFYHLDALAFSDRLMEWVQEDYDFIGPPWLKVPDTPWVLEERVGNGGFALLKVESALKVLYNRYRADPRTYWKDAFSRNAARVPFSIGLLRRLNRVFPNFRLFRGLLYDWNEMENPETRGRQNDMFWADQAADYLPGFRVASVEEGLKFGFEGSPRLCFERNGGKMPFGCHAWARYDRAFWEPHLVPGPAGAPLGNAVAPDHAEST